MNDQELMEKVKNLRDAAKAQGDKPYDHSGALDAAGIKEKGDALTPVAMAWVAALPKPYRILIDYENKENPTGADMGKVLDRAVELLEEKQAAT